MLIEAIDISYTYMADSPAAVTALLPASLTIKEGEFVAIIGATGSGKSTLAQMLAGLTPPTTGSISIDGRAGLVLQEPEKQLFEQTVREDIAFWPKNAGVAPELIPGRVKEALAMVGLDHDRYVDRSPFSLSGGEMRKVAIAGILVMEPRILIMDEPTVGLDPRGKRDLLERIKKFNQAGTAVVMVTHDLDDAAELATRVLLLDEGRIVLDASPRHVFGRSATEARLGLPIAPEIARLLRERGLDIDSDPLTIDELADSVSAALLRASV